MNPKKLLVTGSQTAIAASLSRFHPVVVEGMGHYDPRDPEPVAKQIHSNLEEHWRYRPTQKPKLLIVQGDPLQERGISAITPVVAEYLGVSRALVCLDEDIADYHSRNADRSNVSVEFRYSDLRQIVDDKVPGIVQQLEAAIDQSIEQKNSRRAALNKSPLKDYFRDFALLQEITKAAMSIICGELTVAHTQGHISEFSVTSFYETGIEMGLVMKESMVYYGKEETFDFDSIDKR